MQLTGEKQGYSGGQVYDYISLLSKHYLLQVLDLRSHPLES